MNYNRNRKFHSSRTSRIVWMDKPLEYDVVERGKVVIPKGTVGVGIRFGSSWKYRILDNGTKKHLNVYYYKNLIVHSR